MAVNFELLNQISEKQRDLENFVSLTRTKINAKLAEVLRIKESPCHTLQAALEYSTLSPGKRLRALLLYATVDLLINNKPSTEPVLNNYILNTNIDALILNAACSIELVHTYSLVHDDLPCLDNDDFRRNQPSCHKKFDEATALLVGDALQTVAFDILSANFCEDEHILAKQLKIINILSQAIGSCGMVGGQSLELNHHYLNKPEPGLDLPKYLGQHRQILDKIHLLKTGKLIAAAFQMAAVIADCKGIYYELMTKIGENIGLIYQIKDDISDYNQDLKADIDTDITQTSRNYIYSLGVDRTEQILEQLIKDTLAFLDAFNAKGSFLADLVLAIYQSDE